VESSYYQYGYLTRNRNEPNAGAPRTDVRGDFDPATRRFTATRLDVTAFGEYRFNDVFGINATLRAETLISGFKAPSVDPGVDGQGIDWTRLEAYLGVRAAW
jgi:hypothetical protein